MAKRGSPEWRKKISDSLKKQAEEDSDNFPIEEEKKEEEEKEEEEMNLENEEEKEESKKGGVDVPVNEVAEPEPKKTPKPKVIIDEVKQI